METTRIATLADIEEIEKVPIGERIEASSTYEVLKRGASINPNAVAISLLLTGDSYDSPIEVTYGDFWKRINQTANLFHDLGIGPHDVVSFLLPNLPQTHYVVWGGEAAGIVHPINPLLEASAIKEACEAAKTKVLVALGELPGADIWEKVTAIRGDLPELKAIIRVMGGSDEASGIYGYDEVIERYSGEGLDSKRQIDPQDIASIYGTAGTTGRPKLAPRSHYNEVAITTVCNLIMGEEINPGNSMLCGLPLFHANATMATGIFPFSRGAGVVLLSPRGYRDPSIMENFYKIVERFHAVSFSCVPTVLSVLLNIPKGDADISSLRFAICGAAPLSVELFKRFEEHSGMKVLEGYGLTEGTLVSSVNPLYGERKVGSVGLRLPYQDMKIMVGDGDGMRDASTDEIGSIVIKGPNVFSGYLEAEHNKDVWLDGGWFNTGDLGRMDSDGYFWITGRKKDLIIRGGHNIDPAMIESPLYSLEGVQLAAAVGRPDSHAGEVPVAYVQLQEGSSLTAGDILDYLKREIVERAAIPKEVIVIDEMPLTPIGKIFMPALRWDSTRRVYETELEALGDAVESVEVEVAEDKLYGSMATIKVKPAAGADSGDIENKVNDLLAHYTVRYGLEIG